MSSEMKFEHTPLEPARFHEFANLFPLIQGDALNALREDIRQHGVREPIVFLDGAILDGRNRYMCARDLGLEYPRVEFEGNDPLGFVISHNLHRRHLTESQRAMVAAKLAKMELGANQHAQICAPSQSEAADMLNVSRRAVQTARKVEQRGAPELVEQVEQGNVSVSAAADVAELPQDEQAEIVAKGERDILEAAKTIRAQRAVARRIERLDNLAKIAKGNSDLNTSTRYPVIYADPPWRYEQSQTNFNSRSIENHYPTMALDDICAMPVADLATEDAILYMWATAPKLAESFKVIEAWGFDYRTCMVWDKEKIGMGFYTRNQHELLLICRRATI
ncbi:MAG: Spo0J and IME4 domain-containing protein, partial [Paracoccaceae bacterium]